MTLSTSGYTVGSNQPLNHARILYAPITGTVTAGGTNGALALNDFTYQRWSAPAGLAYWELTAPSTSEIDTAVIAAHNLSGKSVRAMIGGASRTNLLIYTQQFDNAAWTKVRSSVTANSSATIAPDGTVTADILVEDNTLGTHALTEAISLTAGQTYTLSVYIKSQSSRVFRMDLPSTLFGGTTQASFDPVLGTVIASSNSPSPQITSVGNGWYRVSITKAATVTGSSTLALYLIQSVPFASSYTGDGVSGIYLWGAQLEEGSSPTSYIPTTASTVTSDLNAISPWVAVSDNDTIAIMTNNAGMPWQTTKFALEIPDGTDVQIGIIRAGVALQMERPVFGGVQPIGLNRIVETRHAMSESGQWLGRTIQRQARRTTMEWQNLTAAWYRANFEPFSMALPQSCFALIQNPLRMPESVAWCWSDQTPTPSNQGVRDLMQVSLDVTGYLG